MEIIGPVVICLIIILICSFCCWCCKRSTEGTVISSPPPVMQPQQITIHHSMPPYHSMPDHSTHVGTQPAFPPYREETNMPMPVTSYPPGPVYPGYPPPPFGMHPSVTPYPPVGAPITPYPPVGPSITPYPPAGPSITPYPPVAPPITPYPPTGSLRTESEVPPYPAQSAADQQPPSYNEAVAPSNIYSKQSPYNPHF